MLRGRGSTTAHAAMGSSGPYVAANQHMRQWAIAHGCPARPNDEATTNENREQMTIIAKLREYRCVACASCFPKTKFVQLIHPFIEEDIRLLIHPLMKESAASPPCAPCRDAHTHRLRR